MSKYGKVVFAHNGQIWNEQKISQDLMQGGAVFQSASDSEIFVHTIAQSTEPTLEGAVAETFRRIPAAYSCALMSEHEIIVARDRHGTLPLSIARFEGGHIVASETAGYRIFRKSAEHLGSVAPGEMVIFDMKGGMRRVQYADPTPFKCVFGNGYFEEPRSEEEGLVNGVLGLVMNEDFRQELGKQVYYEHQAYFQGLLQKYGKDGIAIVPILDSGKQHAMGFMKASGLWYKEYFQRLHHGQEGEGRSYTASTQEERDRTAEVKHDLREEKVRGKVIITVDDSQVRGTTAKKKNDQLREAGAELIVNVFALPMVTRVCYSGMNHQDPDELLAHTLCGDTGAIAHATHADRTIYLSLGGLRDVVKKMYGKDMCMGCLGGPYPPGAPATSYSIRA
jgi:amidophosphoribosyltransferase